MARHSRLLTIVVSLILIGATSTFAIVRTAPRLNMIGLSAGYTSPTGTYDGIVGTDFAMPGGKLIEFDAENVYNSGVVFALEYGTLRHRHWLASLGLAYMHNACKNPVTQQFGNDIYSFTFAEDPKFNQFDVRLSLDFMFADIYDGLWSPYVGVGVAGGMSGITARGYDSEYQGTFSAALRFGADIKVWKAPDGRSFVTLSSVNSWDVLGSNDRPHLLTIGGGLKYYFRPL